MVFSVMDVNFSRRPLLEYMKKRPGAGRVVAVN
jgi:hypothetical protein